MNFIDKLSNESAILNGKIYYRNMKKTIDKDQLKEYNIERLRNV